MKVIVRHNPGTDNIFATDKFIETFGVETEDIPYCLETLFGPTYFILARICIRRAIVTRSNGKDYPCQILIELPVSRVNHW